MKQINTNIVGILAIILIVVVVIAVWRLPKNETPAIETTPLPLAEEVAEEAPFVKTRVIGTSVEERAIEVYTFGIGDTDILFVGGIHGGYEANTVRLAEAMIDEFTTKPELVPKDITVHIIPNLNPDGYALAADTDASDAKKRFNANGIDLNRNFDCRWAPESSWRSETVSAGNAPFSEPEAITLRDYVQEISPAAAVFWHSSANNVYGSECNGGNPSPETLRLVATYGLAGNYGQVPVFDAYVVTGAAEDWLASIGIPAVTVELETKTSIEWERNLAGTLATLELYSNLAR